MLAIEQRSLLGQLEARADTMVHSILEAHRNVDYEEATYISLRAILLGVLPFVNEKKMRIVHNFSWSKRGRTVGINAALAHWQMAFLSDDERVALIVPGGFSAGEDWK